MGGNNIDDATFNLKDFPEADAHDDGDCGDPFDWPDSDSLDPVEQAHLVARLEDELIAMGLHGGRRARTAGTPEGAALWDIAPDGCPVGGMVWERLWRGVAAAYSEGRR